VRLLLITNDYPPKPGGIQQYLQNLVGAYGEPIHVLAPADPSADPDESGVTRGNRHFMWPTSAVADWIVAEARTFRPDVVLFGAPHPLPVLAGRIRRALDLPVGVLCHGAEVTLPAAFPGSRQVLARTLRSADVVFGVSRYTTRRVEALTGRPVHFLGAGVDVQTFRPSRRRENEVPIVGCVSRFVPRKGQHRLLRAAAEIGEPIEVLLVGRGRKEADLRKMAGELGVAATFAIDVPWSELPDLYRSMDIFVMPCRSRWGGLEVEGLGLVFLEAAATGLPVLAGDSGGSPETVRPGETGYVVHDEDDIVEGLRLLLDDPVRAAAMGAAGRTMVEEHFIWDHVVGRLRDGFRVASA
jgi:phosphatidylinositol alpha-1,6-mannosyltransferase